ncbi:MAG: XdhC family protein, partial [Terrimicrobiaceae bacterium]
MLDPSAIEFVGHWSAEGRRIAAASVVNTSGSTPHQQGLALVVNDSGKVAGAFSGGCVDGEIVQACDEVLATGKPRALRFGPDDSLLGTGGLVCGGAILVWIYQLSEEMACAGEAGSHAGESPAGRIRRFTTERDAR